MLVLTLAFVPSSAARKDYDMEAAGVLGLDLPDGWTLTRQGAKDGAGPALRVVPPAGAELVLLMTPYSVPQALDPELSTKPRVEALIETFAATAAEETIPLRPIDGDVAHGFYISITDKTVIRPTATNFKYVDQGFVALGPIHLKFTILTNLSEGSVRLQAREIVRGAVISPPPGPALSASGTVELAVRGASWALALDLPGFKLEPIETRPDGRAVRITGENSDTGVVISVYVEPAEAGKTAAVYRDEVWRNVQREPTTIKRDDKRSQRGAIAILEYRIPDYQGVPLNQKQINAVLVHGDMWVDLHLSKVRFVPADDALFDKIIASMRIVDKTTTKPLVK